MVVCWLAAGIRTWTWWANQQLLLQNKPNGESRLLNGPGGVVGDNLPYRGVMRDACTNAVNAPSECKLSANKKVGLMFHVWK